MLLRLQKGMGASHSGENNRLRESERREGTNGYRLRNWWRGSSGLNKYFLLVSWQQLMLQVSSSKYCEHLKNVILLQVLRCYFKMLYSPCKEPWNWAKRLLVKLCPLILSSGEQLVFFPPSIPPAWHLLQWLFVKTRFVSFLWLSASLGQKPSLPFFGFVNRFVLIFVVVVDKQDLKILRAQS